MPHGQLRIVDPGSGSVCCAAVAADGVVADPTACC
jgi:hypothetical protein